MKLALHSPALFATTMALAMGTARQDLAPRDSQSAEPLEVAPSQHFEGNDGPWSSFDLRLGTPQQNVRVLISTTSPETLVVLSSLGCTEAAFRTSSGQANVTDGCASSRGLLFNPNTSSTWTEVGTYGINDGQVGLEANLGYKQTAAFGLETLGVGLVSGGSGGPMLSNQTVAGIATASPFYMGIFGLGTQPVNYTQLGNYSAPSYLTSLKTQGRIPSLSWSYTAGAIYRLKQVYGQLIFGGYDTSRFVSNGVSFTMADDVTRDLVVALQSITYSGGDGAGTLLSTPINIFIDSTDASIWLPEDACKEFEAAFGLTLDAESGLYLVNDTHRTALLSSGAEVSFQMSDVLEGGDTATIVLPYRAFDLQASSPLISNGTSYYFPLRRAANETQYTLGRVFLQEAYLSADYERGVFNVSQCSWVEGSTSTVVTIPPKDGNTITAPSASETASGAPSASYSSAPSTQSGGLHPGVIAAICIAILVALALGIFLVMRQYPRKATTAKEPKIEPSELNGASESNDGEDKESNISMVRSEEISNDSAIYQLADDAGRRSHSSHSSHSSHRSHSGHRSHENQLRMVAMGELSNDSAIYQLPDDTGRRSYSRHWSQRPETAHSTMPPQVHEMSAV